MAQKTNLNVSPYYDDFDSDKDFYKVLFNPGRPIQARELSTLQSILQNQIENFGKNIFKDGSVVVPGNIVYDGQFFAVKLNTTNFGVDISVYLDKVIGKKIRGLTSGVSATVQKIIYPAFGTDIEDITIFVKYQSSDFNFTNNPFSEGEELSCDDEIAYNVSVIAAGTPFASVKSENAIFTGSAVSVDEGIYFVRGFFARVARQTIILDPYSNTPSYRVGLRISEDIITSKDDSSLYDNAKGFSNFSAPGADRFKIELSLVKKEIDDFNDSDFVEIVRIRQGAIEKIETKTNYNVIRDYIAQRTYDESGDYSIDQFQISVHNSLNDRLGNDGMFLPEETTNQGNTPSDDLMCVKISPGKAYVRGYDIEKVGTTVIDVPKPRETAQSPLTNVPFTMGNILRINNVSGVPKNRETIQLYNQRKNSTTVATGTKIGDARVYSCALTGNAYSGANSNWDLALFDVQTYTEITLNQPLSSTELPITSYIKGKSSGASGYAVSAGGNSAVIMLRQTSGSFSINEQITINGIEIPSRTITRVKVYGLADIRSIFQASSSGYPSAFVADAFLNIGVPYGFSPTDLVTINTNGTITCPGKTFSGIKTDSIIRYQRIGFSTDVYNRVTGVAANGTSITVSTVPNVSGVCVGELPIAQIQVPFSIAEPTLRNTNEGSLYVKLPIDNISSVNLSQSSIGVIDQITTESSDANGIMTFSIANVNAGITSSFFKSFEERRYSVHYSDGTIEPLTSDQFAISGNTVTISGLTPNQTNIVVNVSLTKTGIVSKVKRYTKSTNILVNLSKYPQSGSGISTSVSDGLEYNQYYGLRVQDEEICLRYPDVEDVIAVYESLDQNSPVLDKLSFSSNANIDTAAIIGENIFGSSSKAIARVVSKPDSNSVSIVYLNTYRFNLFETVKFEQSGITAELSELTIGKYKDVTQNFILDRVQNNNYYGYSKIIRTRGAEPAHKLFIVFDHYTIPTSDAGDVFTVLSYPEENYENYIPRLQNNVSLTDVLDFRPFPSVFSGSAASPFDFSQRTYSSDNPKLIISSNESTLLSYDYYLARVDKVALDKNGNLVVVQGISAEKPREPEAPLESMQLATIEYPPYFYNARGSRIIINDNRRYTMRDIGVIEDRVDNLETLTSLSLLEVSTSSLQTQDALGFDRFKSGFFVDDFSTTNLLNNDNSSIQVNIAAKELQPIVARNTLKSQLAGSERLNTESLDFSTNFNLLDANVQKTGNSVTLKYTEVSWIEQKFATRVENVNPFHVVNYVGVVELTPKTDYWIRTVNLPDKNVERRTQVNAAFANETVWTAVRVPWWWGWRAGWWWGRRWWWGGWWGRTPAVAGRNAWWGAWWWTWWQPTVINRLRGTSVVTGTTENTELVASNTEQYIRSRNTQFFISNLKPRTEYYQFIDGISGVDFVPKLLEVSDSLNLSTSGTIGVFSIGETVNGYDSSGRKTISFRICSPNHKTGQFNSPEKVYGQNPYNSSQSLVNTYSQSSPILNVDTFALCEEAQGKYSGYVSAGTKLVGETSGAIAYVKDLRLISDNYGDLVGTFFIRDPHTVPAPQIRINTGTKTYKVSSSSSNELPIPGSTKISEGETTFTSTGLVNTYEKTITTFITDYVDPLAQSFTVGGSVEAPNGNVLEEDKNGAFLTAVDLFFYTKDTEYPVTVEIRTMELGTPTRTVLGQPVTVRPENILTSDNASVATKITFPFPIYLSPGQEYAVVILSPQSDAYEVFIAQMGEKALNPGNSPDEVLYNRQWAMGSLFKSQNGSIWTANQYQDLKFKLYKAQFTTTPGTVFFYNPPLDESNGYVKTLEPNPITTFSKNLTIGITTVQSSNTATLSLLAAGRRVGESGKPYVTGSIVSIGSSVTSVGISTVGSNYTSQSNVDTYNISGKGTGLKLNITASSGAITAATIAVGGNGYAKGDIVGITTSSAGATGVGGLISINDINGADTLYLNNVQGQSFTQNTQLVYYDASNNRISLGSTLIRTSSISDNTFSTGNVMRVVHYGHGMHTTNNIVRLSNVQSDLAPVELQATLLDSETVINVGAANTSSFATFEGAAVSATNPGYVIIDQEIIKYEAISGDTLTSVTRGQDSTKIETHVEGTLTFKYELNGVSLRRINTTHFISSKERDLDLYCIEIDRSKNGINRTADGTPTGFPELNFTSEAFVGGDTVTASENILFNAINPSYGFFTPGSKTSVEGSIRTISATSSHGSEQSFVDQGYEKVQLNQVNTLSSLRMVASNVNEQEYLDDLPRNKSFTTAIVLKTEDKNLSPILFTDICNNEFRAWRIDAPISNYIESSLTNSLEGDPHAAKYVSIPVKLKNPATALKVILTANRPDGVDFRVLYSISRPDSESQEQVFEFFPGYENLIDSDGDGFGDRVIDPSKNTGHADAFVKANTDERTTSEYQFTANNLGEFTEFTIKIVMSSRNQAKIAIIKEMRAIALV
jgi:hypothetical protein